MRVGIVHGGTSTERDVSTLNAAAVTQVLSRRGYTIVDIPYTRDVMQHLIRWTLTPFIYVCRVIMATARCKGMLDYLDIPYTGSGREAATVINDKILCKKLFKMDGILTPEWFSWTRAQHSAINGRDEFARLIATHHVSWPCVVKAPAGGSYGIIYVPDAGEYERIGPVFDYDDPLLAERFIAGRFITVGLLERHGEVKPLVSTEGVSLDKGGPLITFDKKYTAVESRLSAEKESEVQALAVRVFRSVGARGYARVDFILEEGTGSFFVLEINAVPELQALKPYAFGGKVFRPLL